jgi:hypothetical protein
MVGTSRQVGAYALLALESIFSSRECSFLPGLSPFTWSPRRKAVAAKVGAWPRGRGKKGTT